jgi:hypothetical protein
VPGDERQRPRGRSVHPLCIIQYADQRPVCRYVRQETQGGQSDRESVRGGVPLDQAERYAQRFALRAGKPLEPAQERRAQLMQAGELHVRFRLSTHRPRNPATGRALHQIVQQRGLAGSCLAAEDKYAALARPHAGHQPVQGRTLAAPATQSVPERRTIRYRRQNGGLRQVHPYPTPSIRRPHSLRTTSW